MARQFVMSMYANKEDLYKAKAEYWEKVCNNLVHAYLNTQGINIPSDADRECVIDEME